MADTFEQAVQTVEGMANAQGVKIHVEPNNFSVFADSDRLIQVIVNLLSNAIKFSAAGSQVSLVTEHIPDFVRIKVIDQGRGIPAHLKQSIFNRFQQAQASDSKLQHGSGLGLAICKALVELHGGEIGVDSQQGKGSTFFFTIPDAARAKSERQSKIDADETSLSIIRQYRDDRQML